MDAGVPVRSHVSGIAMGLIHEDGKYVTLTDILGAEDAMGDMDFKVAGTEDAITALQLDTKIDGIPADVLSEALAQARVARLTILDVMNECLPATRDEIAETAPKITTIYIPMDKIGEVIGPKGKIINTIQQETGADIGVDDDGARGIVTIGAVEAWRMEEARMAILNIVDPPKAELDAVYMGRVVNITKFGAFVNILPGRDGLLHISKMGGGKRINAVEDVLELGQPIEVKVDEIDDKGKVSLTPTQPLVAGDGASSGSSDSSSSGSGSSDDAPRRERKPRRDRDDSPAPAKSSDSDIETVSFEDSFDAQLEGELGDLGPKSDRPKADRDGDKGRSSRRRHR
jgi:polyribonucleotide nucleotidyltransferase